MGLEELIHPGSPALIALYIIEAFPTYDEAMKPRPDYPWENVYSSSSIPGSTSSIQVAIHLLRNLHARRQEIAIAESKRYIQLIASQYSASKEIKQQDEKYLPELLKREDWWGVKKQKSNHKQEVT